MAFGGDRKRSLEASMRPARWAGRGLGVESEQDQAFDALGVFDRDTPQYRAYFPEDSRDEAEFQLTRILAISARRWGTHVESRMLARTGQSRSRWQTLFVLSVAQPPVTTSLLSERLAIQWPPLVRTLHSLEADGLIRRYANPHDKRSRYIEITDAGRAVVDRVQPVLSEIRTEVFANLTEEEVRIATRILEKIATGVASAKPDTD